MGRDGGTDIGTGIELSQIPGDGHCSGVILPKVLYPQSMGFVIQGLGLFQRIGDIHVQYAGSSKVMG